MVKIIVINELEKLQSDGVKPGVQASLYRQHQEESRPTRKLRRANLRISFHLVTCFLLRL
jgi:hypothetical protein